MNKDPKYVPHDIQKDKGLQTTEGKRLHNYIGSLLEHIKKHPIGELTEAEKKDFERQWQEATQGRDVVIKGAK